MGHSEDYIRNKVYDLEKQKVKLEEKKLKALVDIRDAILVADTLMLADIGNKTDTDKGLAIYNACKESMDGILKQIDERWSE